MMKSIVMSKPRGFLGLKFGDDASKVARQFSLTCSSWLPWEGGEEFEWCADISSPVQAFGVQANLRLISRQGKIQAIELTFPNCISPQDLQYAVSKEFHLKNSAEADLYVVWSTGEVIHLVADPRDKSCVLTIGNDLFGKAYQNYLLTGGLGMLGNSMRPR